MLQDAPLYAYIPARDMARARKFYEERVGLSVTGVVISPGSLGGSKRPMQPMC